MHLSVEGHQGRREQDEQAESCEEAGAPLSEGALRCWVLASVHETSQHVEEVREVVEDEQDGDAPPAVWAVAASAAPRVVVACDGGHSRDLVLDGGLQAVDGRGSQQKGQTDVAQGKVEAAWQ